MIRALLGELYRAFRAFVRWLLGYRVRWIAPAALPDQYRFTQRLTSKRFKRYSRAGKPKAVLRHYYFDGYAGYFFNEEATQ